LAINDPGYHLMAFKRKRIKRISDDDRSFSWKICYFTEM